MRSRPVTAEAAWHGHRAARAVLAVALLGTSMSCGSDEDPEPAPTSAPSSASSSPTVDARSAAAASAALAAYEGYRNANAAAARTSDYRSKEIPRYVGEPLLGQVINFLFVASQNGIVYVGRPTWSPQVVGSALDASPPTVTIQDCVDSTNWKAVFKATGKSAEASGQIPRVRSVSKVKQVDGRWYVYESSAQRSVAC